MPLSFAGRLLSKIIEICNLSNPKPDLLIIKAHIKFDEIHEIYSSYRPEIKIRMCCGQITVKIDDIFPLAVPNLISTISKHIQNVKKSIDIYSSPETKLRTDVRQTTDGHSDGHTGNQRDTIIPQHYRVAGYKKGKARGKHELIKKSCLLGQQW